MKSNKILPAIAMCAIMAASCAGNKESGQEQAAGFERAGEYITLSEICDSAKTAAHIAAHPDRWKAAFDFLTVAPLETLEAGNYEVLPDGEAFAIVSEYEPRPADSCRFEAHRKYIDLQYLISGHERMGIARPEAVTVVEPYVDDIEFYSPDGVEGAAYAEATPANFFVFFPDDPHRPSMKSEAADSSTVKKVVVKILY